MTDEQVKLIKHYQNMQRGFHDASVRAMEFPYPVAATVFQAMAAEYYAMIERLTIEKSSR